MKTTQAKWTGAVGTARVYFFDASTGEELEYSGAAWMGNSEAPLNPKGERVWDLAFSVDIVDLPTKTYMQVDSTTWGDRKVIAKIWLGTYDEPNDYRGLVPRGTPKYRGNEASVGREPRVIAGVAKHLAKITNRK